MEATPDQAQDAMNQQVRLSDLICDLFGPGVEVSSYQDGDTWEMSLNDSTGVGPTKELALQALAQQFAPAAQPHSPDPEGR